MVERKGGERRTRSREDKVVREALDQAGPEEDARRGRVERAGDDACDGRLGVVRRADAEADGDAERSRAGVDERGDDWHCGETCISAGSSSRATKKRRQDAP